ncbi:MULTISPECIES: hypothetical protein [unclassified Bartonella]|uniref:hypothetical protein n=1 Tax=unclassified Bartonella TaxID=2645622 RepID=UPI0035D139E1
MDLYIVRVFGHGMECGARIGGKCFREWRGKLGGRGVFSCECVMGEKKGEWRMKRVRMDRRESLWVRRVLQRDA